MSKRSAWSGSNRNRRAIAAIQSQASAAIQTTKVWQNLRSLVCPPEHSFSRTRIPRGTCHPNTVSGPNTRTRVLEHTFSAELSHPNTRTQPEHTNTEIRRVLEHAFSNTLYDVSNTAPNTKRLPTGRVLEHAFSNTSYDVSSTASNTRNTPEHAFRPS